jgi:hypothetical protein
MFQIWSFSETHPCENGQIVYAKSLFWWDQKE